MAALLATALAACGKGDSATGGTGSGKYDAMYQGLCATRAQAVDPATARATFFDRAHQPIHELAAETARRDRAAASRLLEAKQAVERDLSSPPGALDADLGRLLDATRTAIVAAGHRRPDPCAATR